MWPKTAAGEFARALSRLSHLMMILLDDTIGLCFSLGGGRIWAMRIRRNPEITGLIIGVIIAVAGGLLILLPFLADLDMMGAGYALLFVGGFIVLAGLITAGMFGYRAARLEAMFSGKNLLAHWIYDPLQVEKQAQRDLQETKNRNRVLFLVMAGFMVACIVLFTTYGYLSGEEDNMPGFVGLMLGILLLLAAFAFGMPYLQYRRAMRSSHEAYIAANGLYINGALHTWNTPLAGLDDVSLVEDGEGTRLVFSLRYLTRVGGAIGYETYTVEVPVPRGEKETARRVEEHFRESNLRP